MFHRFLQGAFARSRVAIVNDNFRSITHDRLHSDLRRALASEWEDAASDILGILAGDCDGFVEIRFPIDQIF